MGAALDLTGQKFGRLVAIEPLPERKHAKLVWLCSCECGNTKGIISYLLTSGATQSCGCLRNERIKEACFKHGLSKDPSYSREQTRRRRSQTDKQTPAWVRVDDLRLFYSRCPEGHHVDHEIPLSPRNGKVSGLHVLDNLQYLPAGQNLKKSDSFKSYIEIKATGQRVYLDD